jgi:alpha-1,3-rhamnosyl/mannosyltransferase
LPASLRERWRLRVLVPNERSRIELAAHCTPDGLASVCFMPAVSEAQLPGIVAKASVLCYPSLDEGFGLPILEAFAAGSAVITSAASSMPEVAGDAAEYCEPHDVDSLAAAFSRLLGDDGRRAQLVSAGQARLAQFSWRRSAEQMRDIFQRSLRRRAGT